MNEHKMSGAALNLPPNKDETIEELNETVKDMTKQLENTADVKKWVEYILTIQPYPPTYLRIEGARYVADVVQDILEETKTAQDAINEQRI